MPAESSTCIEHFSYRSIDHYLDKLNRYTTAEAAELARQDHPLAWQSGIATMMRDLWLYYEQNRGHLDGEHGWILSWLAGQYRWFSHAKLLDVLRAESREPRAESQDRGSRGGDTVSPSLDAVLQLMADELAALRSPNPRLPLGIVWRSPLWDPSGYADDSRVFLKALVQGSRDLAAEEIHWSDATCCLPEVDVALLKTLVRCRRPPFSATITNCIPTLCQPDPRASLNILRTTFETDRIPPEWLPVIEQFDEVWVYSTHDQLRFRRTGVAPERLRVLPGFVDTNLFTSRGSRLQLSEPLKDRFVFLSVFDWQLRKGWDVLIEAYCAEFSVEDRAGLLLKITTAHGHTRDTMTHQANAVLSRLGQTLEQRPDIVLWDTTLSAGDMAALYRSVNAFILPSRGEGWGVPIWKPWPAGCRQSGRVVWETRAS